MGWDYFFPYLIGFLWGTAVANVFWMLVWMHERRKIRALRDSVNRIAPLYMQDWNKP